MWVNTDEKMLKQVKVNDDNYVEVFTCKWDDKANRRMATLTKDTNRMTRVYYTWRANIVIDGVKTETYGDGYYSNFKNISKKANEYFSRVAQIFG